MTKTEREVSELLSKIVELGRRAEKLVSNIRVWFWRSPSMK